MRAVSTLSLGVLMGFVLSRVGFASWDEVHAMFVFSDLRLLLAFMLAVGLLTGAYQVVRRTRPSMLRVSRRAIHKGTLAGGALFGVGWALSGACPSIALVQLGEGQLAAIVTLTGIFVGNAVYSLVHERYFRWDTGSCLDE